MTWIKNINILFFCRLTAPLKWYIYGSFILFFYFFNKWICFSKNMLAYNTLFVPLDWQMRSAVREIGEHFPTAIISGRSRDKVNNAHTTNKIMSWSYMNFFLLTISFFSLYSRCSNLSDWITSIMLEVMGWIYQPHQFLSIMVTTSIKLGLLMRRYIPQLLVVYFLYLVLIVMKTVLYCVQNSYIK